MAWEDWPGFAPPSIAVKELLPIIVAAALWGSMWTGSLVQCHCDNEAVVFAIQGGYCREPGMAHMLRCLFYLEAKHDIKLSARHVPGVNNGVADAISRNQLSMFYALAPQADRVPCQVPVNLVEGLVVQRPWTSADWICWLNSLSMLQ